MQKFPGYLLKEEMYAGTETIVYRALREADQKSVVLKTVQSKYPSISEISQLKYEYQISYGINIPGVVQTYSLEIYKYNIGIIKEDFSAIPLRDFFKQRVVSISEFFEIAIQIAQTLWELHQHQLIHKDINPFNILINTQTRQVKITDFSIASCLQTESYQQANYSILEGTPAYISPEQTGRMNRTLDYRSDLYSLGVTFYELLVGHLPFPTSDLLELIHHHISQYPIPPEQVNSDIEIVVSDIVMKLMAKNAEDRYQSALGLKADLEYCLEEYTSRGYIPNFTLGTLDHNSQFLIPQKLYGRSTEVSKLLSTFEKVGNGATELILVSGYSGIGKTSIVNEIHKPILSKRGYFVRGKFEQLQRNIPYFAFFQGFKTFLEQLLSESSEKICYWQNEILTVLGKNAQIIINNIPELELIIGPQPQVPELGPTEAQNRFTQVFQSFIQAFAKPEHPLVIFVDDLQWADLASLKLIESLITNSDSCYLLLVGAYRDNEVNPIHPLIQILDSLENQDINPKHIILQPLQYNAVQKIVGDTLHPCNQETDSLVELVFNKSGGNPFFINQLLQTFHQENCITFNFHKGRWEWDINQSQSISIADLNVIDLIVISLKKLPLKTQEILKYAACIGNKFNLDTLSIISQHSRSEVASNLWTALQKGLILPLNSTYKIPIALSKNISDVDLKSVTNISYKFLHDRVQQAAYSLIKTTDKEKFHLGIGKLLLEKTPKEYIETKIFDIVNQMNIGVNLLDNEDQTNELAQLNYIAGNKAKLATAYETSKQYFDLCVQLLPTKVWENNYDFAIEVYLLTLEAAYINIDYNSAENLLDKIEIHAQRRKDIVKAYELQIPYYFTQNKPLESIEVALKILRILNIKIPRNPGKFTILFSIAKARIAQGRKSIQDLENIQLMKDVDKLAAMRILMAVIPASFVANPALFPVAISKMVELSLKFGNAPFSIFAYNSYGTLQCGALGNINTGYEFSLLALKLLDQFNAQELKAKVLMVFNAINRPWKDHINESIRELPEGVQAGLEIGDVEYVGHCSAFYTIYLFLAGHLLENVKNKQAQYCEILAQNKQQFQLTHANIWRQVVANLVVDSSPSLLLEGDFLNESVILPEIIQSKNDLLIFSAYLAKSFLAYIFNDFLKSHENAQLANNYIDGVTGFLYVAIRNFYASLAMLAILDSCSKDRQRKYIRDISKNQKQMKKWAQHCPDNFLHKYQLVEAEKARVLNREKAAMDLYDLAIKSADKSGYIYEEAIANERAAEFYFSLGKEKIAQVYFVDSYYGYAKWGAISKVSQLHERYPEVFSKLQKPTLSTGSIQSNESAATTTSLIDLDLASVLKVSQAISEEIVLDQLLEKLMQVLMQSAGAQAGFLILLRENDFVIEASATDRINTIRQSIPVVASNQVPLSVINFVARTHDSVILGKAAQESSFSKDAYIQQNSTKSLLCLPLLNQGQLVGMVYLENNVAYDAFRGDHLEILRLLCAQAAISLENAYLYEDLQRSQAREQAEREINELKSRFISMTSHEFRTPLTAILGTTELIKHYGQSWDSEKQHSYLDRIQKNVKHMTGLLDDVLVLSKADVGKVEFSPAPINLEMYCRNLVEELQLSTKRDQTIEYILRGEHSSAIADEKIVRQILSNLLSNAIKYSSENTIVRFDVTLSANEATFLVQDQGIGIPEADQPHLFDSFQRATNVGQIQGTGLGLAIVKKSVELHKGTISFESVADQGTTFVVTLPITAEAIGLAD